MTARRGGQPPGEDRGDRAAGVAGVRVGVVEDQRLAAESGEEGGGLARVAIEREVAGLHAVAAEDQDVRPAARPGRGHRLARLLPPSGDDSRSGGGQGERHAHGRGEGAQAPAAQERGLAAADGPPGGDREHRQHRRVEEARVSAQGEDPEVKDGVGEVVRQQQEGGGEDEGRHAPAEDPRRPPGVEGERRGERHRGEPGRQRWQGRHPQGPQLLPEPERREERRLGGEEQPLHEDGEEDGERGEGGERRPRRAPGGLFHVRRDLAK